MKGLMWLGVLGLVLLCLLCPWCRAPAIEDDVRSAATACAVEAGLDPGMISVSGRDVTITGMVESDAVAQGLTNCIEGFEGTRKIHNELTVLVPGALGFKTRYGDVVISGVAPTFEKHDAIIDEAISLWGAENVNDGLETDPTRTIGGWTDDDFAQFLAALHHYRKDLDIELTNGQAIISGTVVSELAKERVLGGAAALLPEFEIVDQLTIREPADDREALQASLDALLAGRTVEFETDSANLTAQGRKVLDEVISILRKYSGPVEISGHTDSTGQMDHNLDLSQRRAEAVERYFVAKRLPESRFETYGYGPTRPIASNQTAEGRQKNRRTEFHALKEN